MYGKQRNHTARGWDVASLYLTGDECNPKTPTRRLRGGPSVRLCTSPHLGWICKWSPTASANFWTETEFNLLVCLSCRIMNADNGIGQKIKLDSVTR